MWNQGKLCVFARIISHKDAKACYLSVVEFFSIMFMFLNIVYIFASNSHKKMCE